MDNALLKRVFELQQEYGRIGLFVKLINGEDVGISMDDYKAAMNLKHSHTAEKDKPHYQLTHTFENGIFYAWLDPIHEETHPLIRLGQTIGREEDNVIVVSGTGYSLSLETMVRHIETEEKKGTAFYICIHDMHHFTSNGRRVIAPNDEFCYLSGIIFKEFPQFLERKIVEARALPELVYERKCEHCKD